MKYLAIDLETTGLHAERDRILELACVVLDEHLVELGAFECRFACPSKILADMHEVPKAMHLDTGLITRDPETNTLRVAGHVGDLHTVETTLLNVCASAPAKLILLGSSVHFDRAFLRRWMPLFECELHHRHLDASSVKLALGGDGWPERVGVQHTAMSDIRHSIALVKYGRDRANRAL